MPISPSPATKPAIQITACLWILYLLVLFSAGRALSQQESWRGLFLKTRPTAQEDSPARPTAPDKVAVGYTLFRRQVSGRPVRTSPRFRFRKGDKVFLVVESNADGHLYIFNREGQGPLRLIFPDPRLARGDSRMSAHIPVRIPSDSPEMARHGDWFEISGQPQRERLFLVFAQEPVSGWPRGEELLQHPGGFRLSWNQFLHITRSGISRTIEESSQHDGQPISTGEQKSLSRGLALSGKDPPPSVVAVNSNQADLLVIEIELKRHE